ncbi:hypothetical protein FGO68_gene559 [Halteria grandinella]|uniref:Uncharacterized protein n=1 Tax=Halteria grandinella TaxID=5974 RepID=A0A8J8NZR4_HALGN|nr:hypothetical protein FGO68_gene559 [Halteria grandinella]
MFKDGKRSVPRKDQTMNDRFFHNNDADSKARKQHYEDMRAETKANDEQVRKTNVHIGQYSGWKQPQKQLSQGKFLKPNLPKSSVKSSASFTPMVSSTKVRDAPGLIWTEGDMFKTTKQQMQEEPLSRVNYQDYVPPVEENRNKKNESCLNFSHRIDLKILQSMGSADRVKRTSKKAPFEKDQIFTLGALNVVPEATNQDDFEAEIVKGLENAPGYDREQRNDALKQTKYLQARSSYEQLIQQAKSKLIRTFLDREKRRQNQFTNLQTPSAKQLDENPVTKKISNVYIINQERFHPSSSELGFHITQVKQALQLSSSKGALEPAQTELKKSFKRSASTTHQRPLTGIVPIKQLQSLLKQSQEDRTLHSKLKKQNFHISGHDYDYLPQDMPPEQLALSMEQERPRTSSQANSPIKRIKPSFTRERSKKQLHFRTSFQEQFEVSQLYGADQSGFKREVQQLKEFMAKPNIKFMYSTLKTEGTKYMKSVSPRNHESLRARYDNTNFVNHLPFADKSVPDILKDRERYKTFNQTDLNIAAHRQSSSQLIGNLERNNSLNKGYKRDLLDEHYKLGSMAQEAQAEVFKSETLARQSMVNTSEAKINIKREQMAGVSPAQLKVSNKELVERQNFTIKQPKLSGDVYTPDNYREKSRPLQGFPLETIKEDQDGRDPSSIVMNMASTLNFKDQMMDHRKTNFAMGNENEFSRVNRLKHAQFRTLDGHRYSSSPSPFDRQSNEDYKPSLESVLQHQHQLLSTSNRLASSSLGRKHELSRPGTAENSMSTVGRLRQRGEYMRFKNEGESTRIVLGSEKRRGQAAMGDTAYRTGYQWTVPKYAL